MDQFGNVKIANKPGTGPPIPLFTMVCDLCGKKLLCDKLGLKDHTRMSHPDISDKIEDILISIINSRSLEEAIKLATEFLLEKNDRKESNWLW